MGDFHYGVSLTKIIKSFAYPTTLQPFVSISSRSLTSTRFHRSGDTCSSRGQPDIRLTPIEVSLLEAVTVWLHNKWFTQLLTDRGTSYLFKAISMISPVMLLKAPKMSMKVSIVKPLVPGPLIEIPLYSERSHLVSVLVFA